MLRFACAKPRRTVGGIVVGALAGAMLFGAAGTAVADPAPAGCTAADLARVSATVASETADYLSAHPDANEFFTTLKSAQHDEVQSKVATYMDAHPDVHADLKRIRQQRTDLQKRCQWSAEDFLE